jgi:hypothetical protein
VLHLAWFYLAGGKPTGKRLTHKQKQEVASSTKAKENNGDGGGRGGKKMKRRAAAAQARSSSGKDDFPFKCQLIAVNNTVGFLQRNL